MVEFKMCVFVAELLRSTLAIVPLRLLPSAYGTSITNFFQTQGVVALARYRDGVTLPNRSTQRYASA